MLCVQYQLAVLPKIEKKKKLTSGASAFVPARLHPFPEGSNPVVASGYSSPLAVFPILAPSNSWRRPVVTSPDLVLTSKFALEPAASFATSLRWHSDPDHPVAEQNPAAAAASTVAAGWVFRDRAVADRSSRSPETAAVGRLDGTR